MIKKKGFTLIELLVVIAIIGILAAIVLVSLSGARDKARDARITADLGQVRSAAEIWMDDNGSYSQMATGGSDITTLLTDVADQGGTVTQNIGDNSYCIYSTLNAVADKVWCVDSNLVSDKVDSATVDDDGKCDSGCATADDCNCK